MWRTFLFSTLTLTSSFATADFESEFDNAKEQPYLQNVRQLTFESMGFEKAGEAYFSPDSRTIIFQAVPKGKKHYQIYTLDIGRGTDNPSPKLVSTGIGACTCAYFRPDGQKIIFASSHSDPKHLLGNNIDSEKEEGGSYKWDFTPYMNIYEANPDGSELTALTSGEYYSAECAYSLDGEEIVFASNRSGTMNLYTMKADGSNVFQLTTTDYCYNGGPFFSPDGERIIFRADRDAPDYLQIYVIDKNGQNEVQLTDNGAVNWAPYWHPCGNVIAFATSLHGHRHYEIYLQNIDDGRLFRLTHNESFDGLPVFNLEGTKFLWTSKRSFEGSCQIFIADFTMPYELTEGSQK